MRDLSWFIPSSGSGFKCANSWHGIGPPISILNRLSRLRTRIEQAAVSELTQCVHAVVCSRGTTLSTPPAGPKRGVEIDRLWSYTVMVWPFLPFLPSLARDV